MFFSVIIPIYNVERYLPECLESCKKQNFADAEFLCINDGSSDNSVIEAEKYAQADERFKVINKENGGVSSARNTGILAAKGEYILFLDADDKLKENALPAIYNHAAKDAPDVIVFNADTFPNPIEEDEWLKKTLQFPAQQADHFSPQLLFENRGSMPFIWRHVYKRSKVIQSGVWFDEKLNMGEDAQFPMCIFPQLDSFRFVEDIVLSYRTGRDGSLMSQIHSDPCIVVDKHFDTIKSIAAFWKEKGWLEKWGSNFLGWALKFTLLKVKALDKENRRKKAQEMFECIIAPFGLEKYKSGLSMKEKLMWSAYLAMRKL